MGIGLDRFCGCTILLTSWVFLAIEAQRSEGPVVHTEEIICIPTLTILWFILDFKSKAMKINTLTSRGRAIQNRAVAFYITWPPGQHMKKATASGSSWHIPFHFIAWIFLYWAISKCWDSKRRKASNYSKRCCSLKNLSTELNWIACLVVHFSCDREV